MSRSGRVGYFSNILVGKGILGIAERSEERQQLTLQEWIIHKMNHSRETISAQLPGQMGAPLLRSNL
jgi:hypothetical protein